LRVFLELKRFEVRKRVDAVKKRERRGYPFLSPLLATATDVEEAN
jgi:hypothetical protein